MLYQQPSSLDLNLEVRSVNASCLCAKQSGNRYFKLSRQNCVAFNGRHGKCQSALTNLHCMPVTQVLVLYLVLQCAQAAYVPNRLIHAAKYMADIDYILDRCADIRRSIWFCIC